MTKFYSAATGGFYDKQVHNHVLVIPDPEAVCPKLSVPDPEATPPAGDEPNANWVPPMIEIDDPHWVPGQIEVPNPNTKIPVDAVEISDELYDFVRAQESDHGKIIRAGDDGLPIAVDPDPEPLDVVKARASKHVDSAAEAARVAFITTGTGQALTYQEKEAEAEACQSDPDPQAAFYPFLAASLDIDGETLSEVAALVLARRDAWRLIGAEIERQRLTAKAAIKAATTHEEIQTILDGLTWPTPAP